MTFYIPILLATLFLFGWAFRLSVRFLSSGSITFQMGDATYDRMIPIQCIMVLTLASLLFWGTMRYDPVYYFPEFPSPIRGEFVPVLQLVAGLIAIIVIVAYFMSVSQTEQRLKHSRPFAIREMDEG